MFIYIISLEDERSKKRKELLMQKIRTANLDQFPIKTIGIDGRKVNKEKYKNILGDNFINGSLKHRLGSIGCSLSHIFVCLHALVNKIKDNILVLEDDAGVNDKFLELLPKKMPQDYHLIYLNKCNPINYKEQKEDDADNLRKIVNNITPGLYPPLTQGYCYMLNGKKIENLLNNILPINSALDFTVAYNENLNKYIIDPKLNISYPARGDEDVYDSYRQDIDGENLNLYLKFFNLDRSNITKINMNAGTNTLFEISVDPSMIIEYQAFKSSFNFFIIDSNNEYTKINDYIDVKFIESKAQIQIRFKPIIVNCFKYNTPYKLEVQFGYYDKYIADNITIFYEK